MARIREFRGLRPRKELAEKVAELPYDVVDSAEARSLVLENEYSFFRISKPEVDLPDESDIYDKRVYKTGKKNLDMYRKRGILTQDDEAALYLYTLIMDGREQTGLVACVSIDDYLNNIVRKHELTREEKEFDRFNHLDTLNSQTGPIFILYREDKEKKKLFQKALSLDPEYDFTTSDGIRHIFRVISNIEMIRSFKKIFDNTIFYIADGHHRTASAVKVGLGRRSSNPEHSGTEEYNWFLTVIFPHDQLMIYSYNRVVKDLNGLNHDDFLKIISENFSVKKTDKTEPEGKGRFSMYLGRNWYSLVPGFKISNDPVNGLDVKILQDSILDPVLGIKDPRSDKRIDFIGGIKGTVELKRIVDNGIYSVAFSLYPTSINELIRISDSGGIMPPKSTWFEPKLRSGLVVHLL